MGGHPELGLGQAPANAAGKARSAGWFGSPAASSSSTSVAGAESFRSKWQLVLASLGAGLDGLSRDEGGASKIPNSAEAALTQAPQTASSSTSTLVGPIALIPRQTVEQEGDSEAGATILFVAGSRTGMPVGGTASEGLRQVARSPAARSQAIAQLAESAPNAHMANSGKSSKKQSGSGAEATTLASATTASLSPAIMPPGVATQVANASKAPPRTPLTDRSAESSAGFARNTLKPHSLHPEYPGAVAGKTSAAGDQTAAGTASLASKRAGPSDGDPNGTKLSVSGVANSQTAGAEAPFPKRVRPVTDETNQPLNQGNTEAQFGSKRIEALEEPAASEEANRGSADAQAGASQTGNSRAVPSIAGRPGLASGGRSSAQSAPRPSHESGGGEADVNANRPLVGQSGGSPLDTSTLELNHTGALAVTSAANDIAGSSTCAPAGPATRETFASLDAEIVPRTLTWIHAGAQRAEAGFQDQALGWVGVRADVGAGGVHASLVPGSADAAQVLGGHLAGLNSYLAEQHKPVETLSLAAPEDRWAGPGGDQGTGPGLNQGEGQNAGQGASAEPQSSHAPTAPALAEAASPEVSAERVRPDGAAQRPGPEGDHISLIA